MFYEQKPSPNGVLKKRPIGISKNPQETCERSLFRCVTSVKVTPQRNHFKKFSNIFQLTKQNKENEDNL